MIQTSEAVDFTQFSKVHSSAYYKGYTLTVSKWGRVYINGKLFSKMANHEVQLLASKDKKTIVMNENATPTIKFPKSGSTKAEEFAYDLVKNGIILPAKYIFYFNDGQKLWVGRYQERKPLPNVNSLNEKYHKLLKSNVILEGIENGGYRL